MIAIRFLITRSWKIVTRKIDRTVAQHAAPSKLALIATTDMHATVPQRWVRPAQECVQRQTNQ
jgi:hypothetical protein